MRFGEKASDYLESACIQKEIAQWCSEWIGEPNPDARCVEFGAGPGVFTGHLVEAGIANLIATDVSVRMVEEGRVRIPNVDWKVEDAWNPTLTGVDRIYSCSLLQWAMDPAAVLSKWREMLNKDGKLLATIFIEGSMKELLAVNAEIQAFEWRTESDWLAALNESGFSVLKNEVREDCLLYSNALEAFRSLHSIGAVNEDRFGPGKLRRILKNVDSAYEKSGNVPLTWRTLRVEAEAV